MKKHLLVLGVGGLLLLACVGIAYAADPVLSRILEALTGLGQAQQAQLIKEPNVSQTRDGVSVTVQQVYADANQVVVGFKVNSVDGRRYSFAGAELADGEGKSLLPMMGMGMSGPSNSPNNPLVPGEGVEVVSFDASRIQGEPEQVDLHLALTLRSLPPTLGSGEVGPFTFNLRVPFNPGHAVEVQKTITKAGVDVTLERVVITPSGTRAHICYQLPTRDSNSWTFIANLQTADGRTHPAGLVAQPTRIGEKCDRAYFREARPGNSGLWTLTVTELVGNDLAQPGQQMRWSGPWVFQFQVPPGGRN